MHETPTSPLASSPTAPETRPSGPATLAVGLGDLCVSTSEDLVAYSLGSCVIRILGEQTGGNMGRTVRGTEIEL